MGDTERERAERKLSTLKIPAHSYIVILKKANYTCM